MKSPLPIAVASVLMLLLCLAADDPPTAAPPPEKPAKIELNDLEKQFEKTMSGATLVGRAAFNGKEDAVPKEDRYEISKVTKVGHDLWIFTARFGKAKLPVPLPVPVKWAGDTAVISVTKMKVPGMGTYTARVVVYGDQYAGTWDAGDHGGHMWGRIEHATGAAKADAPESGAAEDKKK
jgi:hypothetical protein